MTKIKYPYYIIKFGTKNYTKTYFHKNYKDYSEALEQFIFLKLSLEDVIVDRSYYKNKHVEGIYNGENTYLIMVHYHVLNPNLYDKNPDGIPF